MIKRIILLIALLVSLTATKAAIGDWTLHTSYHNATHCEIMGGKVYVLASGALFSYDEEDTELRTFDRITNLSDVEISFIAYSSGIDALVIVYRNANIDLMSGDGTVYNIPDFKNKNLTSKDINALSVTESTALLSTSFGVVEIDLEKKEFTNTYTLGKEVYCARIFDNHIYAGTSSGVVRGERSSNLLDNGNWHTVNSSIATAMDVHSNRLYYAVKSKGLFCIDSGSTQSTQIINNSDALLYVHSNGKELLTGTQKTLYTVDTNNTVKSYKLDGSENNYISLQGNTLWNCKGYKGLVACKIENNTITPVAEGIIPNSPIRNYCESMIFSNGKLLVAGGNVNYFDNVFYPGTVMHYDYSSGEWYNYPEEIIRTTTEVGIRYRNVCTIDEDPTQKGHIMTGSFGSGLFEFRDGEFVAHHSYHNTPLESVSKSYPAFYTRVSQIKYDSKGNLWVVNAGAKKPIKILSPDGNWTELYYQQLDELPTPSDIHFDSRGYMWIVSLQGEAGLFCARTNGTLDTSDDQTRLVLSKFVNQDGLSYDVYQLFGFAEDRDGRIWLGTNTGLFVIDNPKNFFDKGTFTQIKVPRNDGTGLADYLMSGVYIQCIYVDGANRKWIGTKHNGIYLLSEDGLETLEHFTADNSPLPSDNVVSVAVNESTGEVFIGTANGIVSYKSGATAPEQSLDESNIYAYPNPVKPDYSGDITIVGLTFDCNIKIVDTAGRLINEGTSTGGSFTWDGRDKQGDRVASGIYYVLTYDSEGNEGASTKILFIR